MTASTHLARRLPQHRRGTRRAKWIWMTQVVLGRVRQVFEEVVGIGPVTPHPAAQQAAPSSPIGEEACGPHLGQPGVPPSARAGLTGLTMSGAPSPPGIRRDLHEGCLAAHPQGLGLDRAVEPECPSRSRSTQHEHGSFRGWSWPAFLESSTRAPGTDWASTPRGFQP